MRHLVSLVFLFTFGLMMLAVALPVQAADPAQGPVSTPIVPVPGNAGSLGGIPLPNPNVSGTVKTPLLNLRNNPTIRAGTLGTISRGELVVVIGTDSALRWAYVRTANGRLGWVYLPYLNLNGSLPTNKFGPR